jgi:hypothetical protein
MESIVTLSRCKQLFPIIIAMPDRPGTEKHPAYTHS